MIRALHIDGSFLAYSRFRATPTHVAERFLRRVRELQASYAPLTTIVSWDTPSGTMKRRQLHADYKAGRAQKEPEYFEEVNRLDELLVQACITQAQSRTGEADDVIATLVRTTPGPHVIYTADKDLLQLVSPMVTMVKAAVGRRHGADMEITHETIATDRIKFGGAWVEGLSPLRWGDLLALAGDPADHIPGIKGIGPSYALRLLTACPEIVDLVLDEQDEAAQAAIAAADPRLVKWALRCCANREDLRISRTLVQLQTLDDIETW